MTMTQLCTSRRMLRRAALASTALCALLLVGCTDSPGEIVDVAGRQATAGVPTGFSEAALLNVAAQMRAAGDLGSAISFYRRAHEVSPSDPKALVELGDTLNQAGAYNEAADAYRKALDLYPNHPEAQRGLGVTLVALNQPAQAVSLLQQSLKATPDARAYGGVGVAEDLLGNFKAAEDAFRQGLKLAPGDLSLRNNLGLSQAIAGQYDAAVETLRGVATDPAAGARHRLNLALALGLAGRTEEAARVARIDLDERAVRSNLVYYAELRALSPSARAQAVFRPNTPLNIAADPPAAGCDSPPCATAAQANETAAPTAARHAAAKKVAARLAAPVGSEPSLPPAPADQAAASAVPMQTSPAVASKAAPSRAGGNTASSGPAPAVAAVDTAQPAMAAGAQPPGRSVRGSSPGTTDAPKPAAGPAPDATALASALAVLDGGDQGGQWIQLAAMPNAKRAERAWLDAEQRGGDVLHDVGHQIQRTDLGSDKGVVFRLRAGPIDSVESARSLCSELKSRGIGCFLVHS
jgi:Flp pilus assembly protein TadD